jgi:hypothetical protein
VGSLSGEANSDLQKPIVPRELVLEIQYHAERSVRHWDIVYTKPKADRASAGRNAEEHELKIVISVRGHPAAVK